MKDAAQLLRLYAETGSEAAFAELVSDHLPLVYAAALRQVAGDRELAKDVAQTVFIDLARKANKLIGRELLVGWLYRSTRFAASKAMRANYRRQVRERAVVSMQETTPDNSFPVPEKPELCGALDDAMEGLTQQERNALLLRFFQGKELKAVGAAEGISEDAARMRVNRSLSKLQLLLNARGVSLTVSGLAVALASESATAVPAELAACIVSTALAHGAVSTGAVSLTLIKTMVVTKIKTGIVGAALIGIFAAYYGQQHHLRAENLALNKSVERLRTRNIELDQQLEQRTSEPGETRDNELNRLQAQALFLQRQLEQAKNRFRVSLSQGTGANRTRSSAPDLTPESLRVDALSREVHSMHTSIMAFANANPLSAFHQANAELDPEVTRLTPLLDWDNLELTVSDAQTLLGLSRTNAEEIIGICKKPILADNGLWIRTYLLANGSVVSLYGDSPTQVYYSRKEMLDAAERRTPINRF
jgi:RNA polymerase sigma factor (sigma-70 family)